MRTAVGRGDNDRDFLGSGVPRRNRTGIAIALVSPALFGASTPLAKGLLVSVDPWMMAGILYLGAGIGLAIASRLRGLLRLPEAGAPLRRSDGPRLAVAVATGGVAGPLLLMSGLSRIDAASASLLLNVEGLATMAIAWLVFRENVDRRLLAGALAILAGGALLGQAGAMAPGPGALLVIAACVCWGVDNNVTRGISGADPVRIASIKGLVAGTVNLALGWVGGASLPDVASLGAAAMLGFVGYGVSLALYVVAQRDLGVARTAAYFSVAPFVGAGLAVVTLGEPVSARLCVAALFMAVGVWLHLAEKHEHEHGHEAMAHAHRHRHDEHHRHRHRADDPGGEAHVHWHEHAPLVHRHPHYPDLHHRHRHPRTL